MTPKPWRVEIRVTMEGREPWEFSVEGAGTYKEILRYEINRQTIERLDDSGMYIVHEATGYCWFEVRGFGELNPADETPCLVDNDALGVESEREE